MDKYPRWQLTALIVVLVVAQRAHKALSGSLTPEDRAQVALELRRTIVQAAVALIVFREPIGWRALYAVLPSLALRYLHSVVGFCLVGQGSATKPHRRGWAGPLLAILHVCDMVWAHYWICRVISDSGWSPLTLAFIADIAILWGQLVMHTGNFFYTPDKLERYVVNLYSCFLQLCVYMSLVGLLASHWYLPIHVGGDAYRTLRLVLSHLGGAIRHKRAFKTYRLKQCESSAACPICLELDDELFVETSCRHRMHLTCVYQWLDTTPQCPVCRSELRQVPSQTAAIALRG